MVKTSSVIERFYFPCENYKNKKNQDDWSGGVRETKERSRREGEREGGDERGSGKNLRRGEKSKGRRVKDGEKGSRGRSAMEKYERVLGVCILDWGRPLSDRERCGCSQW